MSDVLDALMIQAHAEGIRPLGSGGIAAESCQFAGERLAGSLTAATS